ncbi:MAG TPA: hypothetical protein VE545_04365 [Candidatus Dormibacteraeota bacterium]|nr:hypothetical protein [Candidatus Dormibacteraeota bacterium]
MAVDLTNGLSASDAGSCDMEGCSAAKVATLDNHALCLDHFFTECYATLEYFDRWRAQGSHNRKKESQTVSGEQVRAFLQACSGQALHVSLQCTEMTNLQRARLLDVLLWAGELSEIHDVSRHRTSLPASADARRGNSAA